MVNINEFCDRLIMDMTSHLRQRSRMDLLCQSRASCKAIVKSCIDIEPDYVLELGTNYGLSTLSLAYALTILGKCLSALTTIDIDHGHWLNETPDIQRGLLLNAGIDLKNIRVVSGDFNLLNPQWLLKEGKVLVFYDIHDTGSVSYMKKFIEEWIPLFDHGYVMVHDCYPLGRAYWIDRNNPDLPVSSAKHFSGLSLEGYGECKVLIDWLNEQKRSVCIFPEVPTIKFTI
jgi:hypothetical protein